MPKILPKHDKIDIAVGAGLVSFYAFAAWILTGGHGFRGHQAWFFHMRDGERAVLDWEPEASAAAMAVVGLVVAGLYYASLRLREYNGFSPTRPSYEAYTKAWSHARESENFSRAETVLLFSTQRPALAVIALIGIPFLMARFVAEETPISDFSTMLTVCCSLLTAQAVWAAHYYIWGKAFKASGEFSQPDAPYKQMVN